MRTLLLGLAAPLAVFLIPPAAQGQMADPPGLIGSPPQARSGHHDGHDGRRHPRSRDESVFVTYGGEWARYNNRSWESDSFNDWWHDRPDRAYPAWMRRNQDCARRWWSGDTLSC